MSLKHYPNPPPVWVDPQAVVDALTAPDAAALWGIPPGDFAEYLRGFRVGYDAARMYRANRPSEREPKDATLWPPYRRGYAEGWQAGVAARRGGG